MHRRSQTCMRNGFTLVEVLVAIVILSVMAIMSWRALDGMSHAQAQAQRHTDEVMTINAAIAQWKTDLDRQVAQLDANPTATAEPVPMLWDGQSMRITRYSSLNASDGLVVVAWAQQTEAGTPVWRRWQSGPLTTVGAWRSAWAAAEQWATQNPSNSPTSTSAQATTLTPLVNWQINYYRGGVLTNALSAGATQLQTGDDTTTTQVQTDGQGQVDGVRLSLTLPPGGAFTGTVIIDWVRPSRGGGR